MAVPGDLAPPSREESRALRFLVIDDDPIFLAVAEVAVSTLGDHAIAVASDGISGLRSVTEADIRPDVVILDLNMPGLDGLAFLRSLKEIGYSGSVIISSGETLAVVRSAKTVGELLGLRMLGALAKPLDAAELRSMIAGLSPSTRGGEAPARPAPSTAAGALEVYYQPQYDVRTMGVVGLEALARARLPDGSVLGPGHLLKGLDGERLRDFTLDVARTAMTALRDWRRTDGYAGTVSINVDIASVENPGFAERVRALAAAAEVPADRVILELTESTLASDISRVVESLARLRMAGFRLSVDDFGTGGSNFDLLSVCPFTELKIDRTVIEAAPRETTALRFLRFCCEAAHDLKLTVVGEGIEADRELQLAVSAGIDIVQGFLFARPMPRSEVSESFRSVTPSAWKH